MLNAAREVGPAPNRAEVAALLAAADALSSDRGWPQLLASYEVPPTMPKQKRARRGASAEAMSMEENPRLADIVAWAKSADLTQENRSELRDRLESKELDKNAMQFLAKRIVGASFRTKKDAKQAIERWFANRLSAQLQADRIYHSTASG